MEGRSIIHKMHVLERSFLPKLKYSTSYSYHPLLLPEPIPGGARLSASSTEHLPLMPTSRRCRPPSTVDPFHAQSSSQMFLGLVNANFYSLELAGLFDRSTKSPAKSR